MYASQRLHLLDLFVRVLDYSDEVSNILIVSVASSLATFSMYYSELSSARYRVRGVGV